MSDVSRGNRPEVSITFRLSEGLHAQLLTECNHCGCSVSAVVRGAVAREIMHRRAQRKRDADNDVLAGQMTLDFFAGQMTLAEQANDAE